MKLIHCADIHLDSPLRGLEKYEGAPISEIRVASRRAFQNVIDLALAQNVDFMIIAGDLFDGDWPDFNTGLFFISQMNRLREAGIRVFIVRGNHDADSKITRKLPFPENVHLFSHRKPETIIDDRLGVAIHGQSFSQPAVTDDLALSYPTRIKGLFNIGVLHTALTGREGHARYAPCSIDTLHSKEYGYWALGHVHQREKLDSNAWILFPGNLQGRHIKESGPKGCSLIMVQGGEVERVEHLAQDVFRWETLELDASEAGNQDELLEQIQIGLKEQLQYAEGRTLAVRVRLFGQSPAHAAIARRREHLQEEVRALALNCGNGDIWIEKILFETSQQVDVEALVCREDPIGELIRLIRSIQGSEKDLSDLSQILQELKRKLPLELREGEGAIDLDDPAFIRSILSDVERTLVPQLIDTSSLP